MEFNGLTKQIIWLYIFILIISEKYICCNRLFDRIYEEIQGDMACFKRFNGTHEIGCSSEYWGNVGIIQLIENESDFNWFLHNGSHAPYVLVLVPEYFTDDILVSAQKSGKLSGIVLIHSENFTIPSKFSGEQVCPNSQVSLYKNTSLDEYCINNPWNPFGNELLLKNWNFPIFYINDELSINSILFCYNKFNEPKENQEWPLCAIELQSNMFATTNSEVCIRRSETLLSSTTSHFCIPLEDKNVWSSLKPFNISEVQEDNSLIIISTSADASSIFDNISPGAESAVSGLVTLLVTAKALYKYIDELRDSSKNLMFTLFEGEAWDYIGSSRMIYDMKENLFPYKYIDGQSDQMANLNLSHIDSVIDLRQLGLYNNFGNKNVYIHSDPLSNSKPDIYARTKSLIDIIISESSKYNINMESVKNKALPPSSFQSFLKEKAIPGLVLTDHKHSFKNLYYQSIFDDYKNLNYKFLSNGTDKNDNLHKDITDIASILASSFYKILTGKDKTIRAEPEITNELMYCYLVDTNCTLFRKYSDYSIINYLYSKPAKMYVSVKRGETHLTYLTGRILSHFMGREVDINETDCKSNSTQIMNLYYFPFIDNGSCIESTVHYSSALSPAFVIKNYDWKSGLYSTWTESTWQKTAVRIFLRPSPAEEITLIICGIIVVILSILIIYFLNSRANVIFNNEIVPTSC